MVERTASDRRAEKADQIVEACLRCLARDGFAATSIASVAREAGVDKRLVLYYHETREQLIERVVARVGDRLVASVQAATAGIDDPELTLQVGFDRLWRSLTTDRALLVAWLGLRAEAITDRRLRASAGFLDDRLRDLVLDAGRSAEARGLRLRTAAGPLTVLIVAALQGLVLEWLEHGDTPDLHAAIADFQAWLASRAVPVAA
ncbi:TetR/AcrR family transcriptional regulator [Patulibacter defluvii]|uniref:TetR/AcrR family transcriptional regulator n=1 Tax=Patulibacter defluvii TaxID=3095358 RepID=UPI002A74AD11|nr:TetR family transcriptional regulator [Patulibacter sp. DM4]